MASPPSHNRRRESLVHHAHPQESICMLIPIPYTNLRLNSLEAKLLTSREILGGSPGAEPRRECDGRRNGAMDGHNDALGMTMGRGIQELIAKNTKGGLN